MTTTTYTTWKTIVRQTERMAPDPLMTLHNRLIHLYGGYTSDYQAFRTSVFTQCADRAEIISRFENQVAALRQANKRRGHALAKKIAQERDYAEQQVWAEMMQPSN